MKSDMKIKEIDIDCIGDPLTENDSSPPPPAK